MMTAKLWLPLLIAALVSCAPKPNGSTAPRQNGPAASDPVSEATEPERALFDAINEERIAIGVKALEWHPAAGPVAREHSRNMATRWFFSHLDPQGRYVGERLRSVGIQWRWAGENIYQQNGGDEIVGSAVRGWMKSAGHRENILNRNFTHTGVGIVQGADGTIYCTQVFLQPL